MMYGLLLIILSYVSVICLRSSVGIDMLYKKVMQDLKARIYSDEFRIGDTLPSEKELIQQYDVSRITIRKAIDELVKLKLVEKRQGAGSSVIGKTMIPSVEALRSTSECLSSTGSQLEYKIIEFQLLLPDENTAKILDIDTSEQVYFIRRYMLIDGVPSIYEDTYMPMAMFPKINILSLQGSKYHYLESELGLEIDGAQQRFEAILPEQNICDVLGVNPSKPLIRVLSIGKLKDGRTFEYTEVTSKPDVHSYDRYLKRHH